MVAASLISLVLACGSGSDDDSAPAAGGSDELAEVSRTLLPDRTFTLDDYVVAGWKKSKQFPTDTVPESTDIWYGFFNQKDIEIRFYDSHETARTAGAENAAAAIDQSFREGGQFGSSNRGAGSSAVTKFKAFSVVGNTVILCEQSVDACVAVANAVGG